MENRMEDNPRNDNPSRDNPWTDNPRSDNPRRGWYRRNKWIFFVAPLALVAFIAIGGEVVLHLWNWLAPALFGWRQINFWQALGLLVLSRILFGGWGGHGRGHDRGKWRRGRDERWAQLTPEEREKFRQGLHSRRCGPFSAPPTNTNEPA
jgi:hypothetical protein